MTSLKTTALALILIALSGPALAQTTPSPTQSLNQSRSLAPSAGAAATLPNTFDSPAAAPTPAPPIAPAPAGPAASHAQMAEGALRAVIDQFRAAEIDEELFTPGVAAQLNTRLANYSRVIRGYGEVQSIEPLGANGGVGEFLVLFDNAATQWQVGLDEAGLIAAVRFREAPPESSEPPAPATPAAPARPGA
ncbi:hypothetical protein ACETK8_00285 [Brevundimonas staleyi]|uniref:DUF3887 domain-containing protein n=1 Tax=Brevundimonas staleyi TaxID=74326 RepID=A0ABW0FS73_9CAUL